MEGIRHRDQPPIRLTSIDASIVLLSPRHLRLDVRFGSLADIAAALPDVRFTLESRHRQGEARTLGISVPPSARTY